MQCQYFLILAVSFIIFCNVASGFQFDDCESEKGKLTYIEVSGCNTASERCVLKRGTKVPITMGFTVFEEVTVVNAFGFGKGIVGSSINIYDLGSFYGCVKNGLKCPLQKGTNHEYKGVLDVHEDLPKAQFVVAWKMLDQNNKMIVCVQFPVKFV